MARLRIILGSFVTLAAFLTPVSPAGAATAPYQTGFARWRAAAGGFSAWQRSGVSLDADGALRFDPQTTLAGTDPYPAGGYYGGNFYNGGSFLVGEALSPATAS